jgi:hypothetical protein
MRTRAPSLLFQNCSTLTLKANKSAAQVQHFYSIVMIQLLSTAHFFHLSIESVFELLIIIIDF